MKPITVAVASCQCCLGGVAPCLDQQQQLNRLFVAGALLKELLHARLMLRRRRLKAVHKEK